MVFPPLGWVNFLKDFVAGCDILLTSYAFTGWQDDRVPQPWIKVGTERWDPGVPTVPGSRHNVKNRAA